MISDNGKAPAAIALAWADASARGDLETAVSMLADDVKRYGGFTWMPLERAFYVERWKIFLDAFSPYELKVVNCLTNGRTVALEMIESGTFSRPYVLFDGRVLQPDFQSYVDHVCTVVAINDAGLINEIRAYIPSNLERLIASAVNAMPTSCPGQ
jgi:hypothetical protein